MFTRSKKLACVVWLFAICAASCASAGIKLSLSLEDDVTVAVSPETELSPSSPVILEDKRAQSLEAPLNTWLSPQLSGILNQKWFLLSASPGGLVFTSGNFLLSATPLALLKIPIV